MNKKWMKIPFARGKPWQRGTVGVLCIALITLSCVMLFVSCTNDDASDGSNAYWSCKQLLDTSGLELYPFDSFTDEEWRTTSYSYKLERRQIPEDFLSKMTTKA